jgi:5,10-methylenetetrahydromethanopterin reductase
MLDGDEFVVTGQKVWNSGADVAEWGMLLTRTNKALPKHSGITWMMIDMRQESVEVRPLVQMNGDAKFCEVFLTGARVPVDNVIGGIDNGWAVARTTLSYERGSVGKRAPRGLVEVRAGGLAGNLDRSVGELLEDAKRAESDPTQQFPVMIGARSMIRLARDLGRASDPVVRDRVVDYYVRSEVHRLNGLRARDTSKGGRPGPEGSIRKLGLAMLAHRSRDVSMSMLGAEGMLVDDDARDRGKVQRAGLSSFVPSLGGGTNEIQRNIIGERSLGLPREPSNDTTFRPVISHARDLTMPGRNIMGDDLLHIEHGWGMPWPGAELAGIAEAAGCQAFCAGEFADRNAYVTLTQMAESTTMAKVGTGIAYAFARSPFVHASAVRQIDGLAPGRVFLGLGSGTRRMNADWFAVPADRTLGRMADMVGAIKAYLSAPKMQTVRYEGEFYPIDAAIKAPVLGPIDVPVVLGAFNEGMLRVAGRVADGIIGHGLFTDRWWDETIDPNLGAGAAANGRDPSTLRRWGWVITSVDDDDPARAERDARLMIAFYVTVKRTTRSRRCTHGVAQSRRSATPSRPTTSTTWPRRFPRRCSTR